MGCVVPSSIPITFSRVISITDKTVTSPHALKMADSVPLDTTDSAPAPARWREVDSVLSHILIARQKTGHGQKGGPKAAVLTDDVKLKLAQHISSELDARHVLQVLISSST